MYLEIVSPEATLFSSEVDSVVVPGVNGEFEMIYFKIWNNKNSYAYTKSFGI